MKTIILSAFRRFGSYLANSTEIVALELHDTRLSGFKIKSAVFECAIPPHNRGEILFDFAQREKASGIICLGMASDKKGLCVETTAKNVIYSKYCPAHINGTPIDHALPYGHPLDLDLASWNMPQFEIGCMKKNIPLMNPSDDPGGFCCNHLMFQLRTLQLKEAQFSKTPFIYIHTPCSPEAVADHAAHKAAGKIFMPTDQVIAGLDVLIKNASLPKHH